MSALAASSSQNSTSLRVLVLSYCLSAAQLTSVLTNLKESSKKAQSHKTRQLLWKAYGDMIGWVGGKDGSMDCFLKFSVTGEDVDAGVFEVQELTKRQRGCCGGLDTMGRKHKPTGEEDKCKGWVMGWAEEEADEAWRDLMDGEPCVYCTGDKVRGAKDGWNEATAKAIYRISPKLITFYSSLRSSPNLFRDSLH